VAALPASILGATAALEIASIGLSWDLEPRYDTLLYAVSTVTLAAAGALIASRHPQNPIGWLFCWFALLNAVGDCGQGYGLRAAEHGWAYGAAGTWVNDWGWLPSGTGWMLTFLLFPDGRFMSKRWRLLGWAGVAGLVLAWPGWALSADRGQDFPGGRNPFAVDAVPTDLLAAVGLPLFLATFAISALALIVRFRRSAGVERQQVKWVAFTGVLAGLLLPISFLLWYRLPLIRVLPAIALTAIPISACVAILRYRLYDIDIVIRRTLVYGALTICLAAAYAATALGLGTALGSGSAWATAGATLVVALAFRPVRARMQAAVDRRFSRARYDALHRVAAFLTDLRAGRAAPDEVEALLREMLADPGLELRFFPPGGGLSVDSRGRPAVDAPGDARVRTPIERAGAPVALVLHAPGRPEDESLLRSLVDAGGLAIEIARLHVELRRQLKEVQASRARIVAAGDAERRRLERDLHDGAQQRLVSIGLTLRHAQHELGAAPSAGVSRALDDSVAEIGLVIAELRELARGVRPAQLDAGLAAALTDLAGRSQVPVEVRATGERFPSGVEAAAYFIACEGLTNAVKHAAASRVLLSAERRNGTLVVSVSDDGVGGAAPAAGSGLAGLEDRVVAHGGTLRIESAREHGTTLTAELPCES
jgi:signal transduction histidine kinase